MHWTFGESTLRRVVEYEGPILSPFEIFGDCTQAHLDQNRTWLVPRFQDATSGILIITIQSFLIRRNGLTILVDACGGNDKEKRQRSREPAEATHDQGLSNGSACGAPTRLVARLATGDSSGAIGEARSRRD